MTGACFIFTCFMFAAATAKDFQTLMLTRFFSGVFVSCPLAVVGGAFSDMFGNETRGIAIAAFSALVFLGLVGEVPSDVYRSLARRIAINNVIFLTIIELLRDKGALVDYNDPYFPKVGRGRHYDLNMTCTPLDRLADYDAVVIVTDHTSYDYAAIVAQSRLVVDARNATKGIQSPKIVRS